MFNSLKLFLVTVFGLLLMISSVSAAPKSELIPFWLNDQQSTQSSIDHSAWDTLLKRYLVTDQSGVNLFQYSSVSQDDKKRLSQYLEQLQAIDPRTYSKGEQKAYWINLYNAATVNLILEHYPVKSITKISERFFGFGPWDDDLLEVAGQTLTLNNIEHGILRPIWNDNRIHYAVNCASYGCPNLQKEAFTADNTEALLELAAVDYINHPRGVTVQDNELHLSSIYHWYLDDFGGELPSLLEHLKIYAKPPLSSKLDANFKDYEHDYDWSLNQPR
jgi:hypothetical protein